MALNADGGPRIHRLATFGLTTGNADRLAQFYRDAFGACLHARERRSGARFERLMGIRGGADCVTIGLGRETIELVQFDEPGQPYPHDVSADDLRFQHFAIVVADMHEAMRRMTAIGGWTHISRAAPQRLPHRSGDVTAFKFRDPDRHPLELLAFPGNHVPAHWQAPTGGAVFLGIDHSAISVRDTGRSIAFYEQIGLRTAGQTVNHGIEQQRLDGVPDPHVEVTALLPAQSTPHLELLCYRVAARPTMTALQSNDIAATRLLLETDAPARMAAEHRTGSAEERIVDPDGHHLLISQCHRAGDSLLGSANSVA